MNYTMENKKTLAEIGRKISTKLKADREAVTKQKEQEARANAKLRQQKKVRMKKLSAWINHQLAEIESRKPKTDRELLITRLNKRNQELRKNGNPVLD